MPKTIYINENALRLIKESILVDTVPEDIVAAVANSKTSLGKNPALPDIFGTGFLEKLTSLRFNEAREALKNIGSIEEVDTKNVSNALYHLLNICQDIERPFRQQIEKICFNKVIELFSIPDDSIDFDITLVDSVDLSDASILLEPEEGENDFEFEDMVDADSIRDEIFKRRLLDSMSMGCAIRLTNAITETISEIQKINPRLGDLYRKIMALNDYLLFTKEDFNLTDKNKKQLGTVTLSIGDPDKKPIIRAQGVVFPILLCETIHGCMEFFASHGLPKDKKKAIMVISKSDFLKAEPWDMRLGPALWDTVFKQIDEESEIIPHLYYRLAKLPVKKFNFLMKEIFMKTRKGKRILAKITGNSKREMEYTDFGDQMAKMNPDKSVISDDISPEEL